MLIKEWLRKLVEKEGLKVFENTSRIDSMLSDLYPKEKKERAIIKIAFDNGIEKDFIYLFTIKDRSKSAFKINQIRNNLGNNLFVSEEATNYIIETFSYIIGVEEKTDNTKQVSESDSNRDARNKIDYEYNSMEHKFEDSTNCSTSSNVYFDGAWEWTVFPKVLEKEIKNCTGLTFEHTLTANSSYAKTPFRVIARQENGEWYEIGDFTSGVINEKIEVKMNFSLRYIKEITAVPKDNIGMGSWGRIEEVFNINCKKHNEEGFEKDERESDYYNWDWDKFFDKENIDIDSQNGNIAKKKAEWYRSIYNEAEKRKCKNNLD